MRFSTMSFVKTISCILLLGLLVSACKKGDTGPAGATGDAGPTGATGAAGPKGTANVYYSAWVYASSFRDSIIDNSNLKLGTIAAPQMVDSIVNKGTLLVYFTYGGGVQPMPYTSNAGGKTSTLSFIPMLNRIFVTRFTHDNSNAVALSTLLQYRYIIIPGGIGGRQMDINYAAMTYQEVCSFLRIPE